MNNRYQQKNKSSFIAEQIDRPVMKPERFFGFTALVVGLFMALSTPPFQSPDEDSHFFRALQLSEGRIIALRDGDKVGGYIPGSVVKASEPFEPMRFKPKLKVDISMISQLREDPFANEPRVWREFMHTAIYSPVAYAPAVVGIWIVKLSGSSALVMMYAARLVTLLCWIGLVYTGIRQTPVFKWTVVLISLLPMSVFLAGSISADVMTNGFSILLTSLILKSAFAEKGSFNSREGLWILLVSVLLALTKQVYFLLAALAMTIPTERFGGGRRKTAYLLMLAGAAIAVNIIWAWLVRGVVVTESWADPGKQVQFIMEYPWEYIQVLVETLSKWWWKYTQWFVGVLGWLDTKLPPWIYPSYIAMILGVAILDKGEGRPMEIAERFLVAGISAATLLLIATSQYITYTIPMAPTIRGVQGRYFIPLAVAALLVLYNRKVKVQERLISIAVMIFCSSVLVVTCYTLIVRYYA
jgi:uncharacterized membrane protein